MHAVDTIARLRPPIFSSELSENMFPTTSNNNRNLAGAGSGAAQLQHISLADGVDNTLVGINAGTMSANRGSKNTNVGANAGANAGSLDSCTLVGSGTGNLATYVSNAVAVGALSLESGFAVYDSVAVGSEAGRVLSQSRETTLVGYRAGAQLASATETTAVGSYAAYRGTNVISSTFVGSGAAEDARGVFGCVAVGAGASGNIRDASNNVAVGAFAATMATGNNDTYVGFSCASNAIGGNNVFVGCSAGAYATVDDSVIIGAGAGRNAIGSNVVIIGAGGGGGSSGNGSTILGAGAGANATGNYLTDIGFEAGKSWIGDAVTFVGALAGNATGRGNFATGVGAGSMDGGVVGDYLTSVGSLSGYGWVGGNSSFVGFAAGFEGAGNRNQVFGSSLLLNGNDNVLIGSLAPGSVANIGNVVAVGSKLAFGASLLDSVVIGKNVSAVHVTSNAVLIGSDFAATAGDNGSVVIALGGARALAANGSTLTMGPTDGEYFVGNSTGVKLTVVSGSATLPVPPTNLLASTTTLPNAPIPGAVGNVYGGGTYVASASSATAAAWHPFGQSPYDAAANAWQSSILYSNSSGAYLGTATTPVKLGTSTFSIPGEWVQVEFPASYVVRWLNYFYVGNVDITANVVVAAMKGSSGVWDLLAGNSWVSSAVSASVQGFATDDFYVRDNSYSKVRYIVASFAQPTSTTNIGTNFLSINIGTAVRFANPSTFLSDELTTLGGPTHRAAAFSADATLIGPIGAPWVTANVMGVFADNMNVAKNVVVGGFGSGPNIVCVYGNDRNPESNTAICGLGMGPNAMRYNGFGHRWHNTFAGDLVTMYLSEGGYLTVLNQVTSSSVWGSGSVTCGDGIDGSYPNLLNMYGSGGDRFNPLVNTGIMGVGLDLNTLRFNGYNHRWYNTRSGGATVTMELDSGGNLYVEGAIQAKGGLAYSVTAQRLSTATGTATWASVGMTGVPIGVYSTNGMYISSGNYWAASDARKKFRVVAEDPAECAASVRAARLVTYETKDGSPGRHLGFVAQEAAEAAPGSVTLVRDVVPSVLEFVTLAGGRTFEFPGAGGVFSGEHVCGVRFEVGGRSVDANVALVSRDAVTVDVDLGAERAFVVGPVVDDFHALDYQRMWATAFGAVQHLLKEHDALEDRVKRIEARLGL